MAPPCISRQLSSFIDRMRENSGPGEFCGETLDDWHARQAAWDARQAEARAQWGVWPEAEEEEEEEEWEIQEQEARFYDQTFFKLREVTPLARLKAAFCQRKGVNLNQVDFLFGGACIEDDDTPEGLTMQEGDVIDAVWRKGPLMVERESAEVERARVARMETERHPTGAAHANDYLPPAQRVRPRQTRHARAERLARYMRGEGQCLNVCVESWLEDWLSSVAIQQAAIQQALAGEAGQPERPNNALFSNEQQLAEQMAALEQQYAARREQAVADGNRGA